MASVNKDAKGWRVLFVSPDGTRKTLRLTGLNRAKAESIGRHVDELCSARGSGQPVDRQTALWLADIGQGLHDKLANAGLVARRSSSGLAAFMAEYIGEGRTTAGRDAANATRLKWVSTQRILDKFFPGKTLRDISADDASRFRRWLDAGTASENTKRKHVSVAKMFFNVARRRKLVDENPFEFEKAAILPNRSRDFYLSRPNALKLIESCPDTEWRLLVALWRFAGLRKMEVFQLRWEHVLWDQGRMLVTCPKTAHHEGKGSRFVPIGDILPWLEQAFDEAAEGSERIITRFTDTNVNLGKPFNVILQRAGMTPWPKLFQNMRASCETDWLDSGISAHVVATWIGHSVKIQNQNYAQVDDHHFEKFNAMAGRRQESDKVAHQVAQQTCERARTAENSKNSTEENASLFASFRTSAGDFSHPDWPRRESNHPGFSEEKQAISETGGTPGGTLAGDSDLQAVIEAWPGLPAATRRKIVRLARTAADGG